MRWQSTVPAVDSAAIVCLPGQINVDLSSTSESVSFFSDPPNTEYTGITLNWTQLSGSTSSIDPSLTSFVSDTQREYFFGENASDATLILSDVVDSYNVNISSITILSVSTHTDTEIDVAAQALVAASPALRVGLPLPAELTLLQVLNNTGDGFGTNIDSLSVNIDIPDEFDGLVCVIVENAFRGVSHPICLPVVNTNVPIATEFIGFEPGLMTSNTLAITILYSSLATGVSPDDVTLTMNVTLPGFCAYKEDAVSLGVYDYNAFCIDQDLIVSDIVMTVEDVDATDASIALGLATTTLGLSEIQELIYIPMFGTRQPWSFNLTACMPSVAQGSLCSASVVSDLLVQAGAPVLDGQPALDIVNY
eukprot:gnl/Dysnectes_brevis/6217_a9478_490.p1 GENE.gnl/Dysnectes_brevis/6217_a9478_490~~gnl/Dysnectes_brevis/6217_a9478_490.p1  ORF type:complete len:364 (+),score=57.96 gnl/Dysnectes_brevis/6217_a9478_490:298-1389(+)